jgi:hypothetical protein
MDNVFVVMIFVANQIKIALILTFLNFILISYLESYLENSEFWSKLKTMDENLTSRSTTSVSFMLSLPNGKKVR